MEEIKVTVIIPVFNVELYLRECLESIRNQTLQEIEIICVNDGSIDKSSEILKEYENIDTRIIVISQENEGLSSARNRGLEIARGKYVYFMDSDDYLDLDALEILFNESESKDLDVLYFDGESFWDSEELKEKFSHMSNQYMRGPYYSGVYKGADMMKIMIENKKYIVSSCLQFTKRELLTIHSITFYKGILHEDNLFMFYTIINANRTACINKALFHRRVRNNSIMTKEKNYNNAIGIYICYKNILNYSITHDFDYETQRAITGVLGGLIGNLTNIYNCIPDKDKWRVIYGAPPLETYLFSTLIKSKMEITNIDYNYKLLLNSKSYKIGRIITYIPRKIKGLIWLLSNKGIKYTYKRIIFKLNKK